MLINSYRLQTFQKISSILTNEEIHQLNNFRDEQYLSSNEVLLNSSEADSNKNSDSNDHLTRINNKGKSFINAFFRLILHFNFNFF